MVYGLISITIFKDTLRHIEYNKCPFISSTIIYQLHGGIESLSKGHVSLDDQAHLDDVETFTIASYFFRV